MSARLAVILALALVACGGSETSPSGPSQDAGGAEVDAGFDSASDAGIDAPADAPTNAVTSLALTHASTPCAILGSGRVACWGNNDFGQVGAVGPDGGSDAGAGVTRPEWVPGIITAAQVATGNFHACALLQDGTVTCWGDNSLSQLGPGTSAPVAGPTAVPGLDSVSELCAGARFSCALRAGAVLCWGSDNEGQLGDARSGDAGANTSPKSAAPLVVPGVASAKHISCGAAYACALLKGGTALCWGYDEYNELGDGVTRFDEHGSPLAPVSVKGLSSAGQVALADDTNLAVVAGDQVVCWGGSPALNGICGDASTLEIAQLQPVQGISSVLQASGGIEHACALGSSGGVWCWGYNHFGQIGQGYVSAPAPKSDPVPPTSVPGLAGVVQVAAGYSHTCALLANHEVWCWGNNKFGQIGAGTTSDAVPTPTKVTFPAQ